MSVIYLLLPLALCLGGIAVFGFLWALRNGQLDDLTSPPVRILFDDENDPVHADTPHAEDKPPAI